MKRLIGSNRRECLDHVIVLGERHLYRVLKSYFEYYNESRTHLSLNGNSPTAHGRAAGEGAGVADRGSAACTTATAPSLAAWALSKIIQCLAAARELSCALHDKTGGKGALTISLSSIPILNMTLNRRIACTDYQALRLPRWHFR